MLSKYSDIMGFITKRINFANWELSLLKLSALGLGIILGSYFADFWKPILWFVWIIFILTGIWITIIWIKEMKK